MIIGTVLTEKEMKNSTNYLILNMAFADLIVSGFVESFRAVGILDGKSYFDQSPGLCKLVGAVCFITCGVSVITVACIAINRFLFFFYFQKFV